MRCQRLTPNNFRSSIPVLLLGFAPFYQLPKRVLSTTQLSYQPQEAVLFSCSLRANPAGTSLTSTQAPLAIPNP